MKEGNRLRYYPWDYEVHQHSQQKMLNGSIPILDLELSAYCKLRHRFGGCIYCDSETGKPEVGELSYKDVEGIVQHLKNFGLEWIFMCGKGEPMDDPKFWRLAQKCNKLGIKLSVFTNGLIFDAKNDEDLVLVAKKLYTNKVNLIVKCDSLNPTIFANILGLAKNEQTIMRIYKFMELLLECGYCKSKDADLALSIVPLDVNIKEIPRIVEYCLNNQIFPLIGQLECAGKAETIFHDIAPSEGKIEKMLDEVNDILGYEYEIPVCPAAIYALHMNNKGDVVVDKQSGLSCFWFYLSKPHIQKLGNIKEEEPYSLFKKMEGYRMARFETITIIQERCSQIHLGGCGGKRIIEEYIKFMKRYYEKFRIGEE